MKNNNSLHSAKKEKNDEFYTQLEDIEKECVHYVKHFKDKIVLCNCNDVLHKNFTLYFYRNFKTLGLKKLIATGYKVDGEHGKVCSYDGNEWTMKMLEGDGGYSTDECIEFLKESDIVVTNPPFSLFRDYVAQLMEYDKKFIILGNQNAITYKEIFPLIMSNKIWFGQSIHSGDREFGVPDDYPLNAAGTRVDEKGHKFIRVKGVRWYTNLDYKDRHEEMILVESFSEEKYPHYDNYDAIEVKETKLIPKDYDGMMGVPITFLDKYNPDQFEIVGVFNHGCDSKFDLAKPILKAKELYTRIAIRRRKHS